MKSSSILTRRVFRAILAERPYKLSECRRQITSLQCQRSRTHSLGLPQRRSMFALPRKLPSQQFQGAKPTPKNLELALGKLVDLVRARRTHSRTPDDAELVDALRFLFIARSQSPNPMTRNEIFLASETFSYLRDRGLVLSEEKESSLTTRDLQNILLSLVAAGGKDKFRSDSRALSTAVFESLQQNSSSTVQTRRDGDVTEGQSLDGKLFELYVTVLARTGSSLDALELLRSSPQLALRLLLWVSSIKGLANEGRTSEIWQVLGEVKKIFGGLDPESLEDLTSFFAEKEDVETTRRLFDSELTQGMEPTTNCLVKVLSLYIKTGHFEIGAPLVKTLRSRTDSGDAAGVLLLWHAAQTPEITQLQNMVEELAESSTMDAVTMRNFNRLVQYAYSQNEPNLANNYVELAKSFGLRPDAETYSLQLDFELQKGDMNAATRTFELLTIEDLPDDRMDVPVLNRYISVLSSTPSIKYDLLMRVVDRILETGSDLQPESIAGLCRVFLQNDDIDQAVSLLRHRVDFYPMPERARIAAVFPQFILDPNVNDQRAYNAYELFRHAFPETSVSDRLPIMQSFFDRKRPDLGCLVFGHMRQREDLAARPTAEAYAQCYEGIARCKDVDGLQMVYNMLKLDREVEVTTRIHNALMQAYTACQLPFLAIIDHFWKILDSREGPTLSSFALALRACETWVPQGGQEARRIVALMQKWNLVITKELYDCYIGALAGQSEFENVIELIEEMENDIGEPPDAFTLGTFYNAIPWQYRKDEVEAWAKKAVPELWADLQAYGDEIDEEWEVRYFKIDRTIDVEDEPLFAEGEYSPELARPTPVTLDAPES